MYAKRLPSFSWKRLKKALAFPGVYLYVDALEGALYCGSSKNVYERLNKHREKKDSFAEVNYDNHPIWHKWIWVFEYPNYKEVEAGLLRVLHPRFNCVFGNGATPDIEEAFNIIRFMIGYDK